LDICYQQAQAPLSDSLIGEILDAARRVFEHVDAVDVCWRLEHMHALTVFAACHQDRLCGFKIGYAITSHRYYSWLGGVDPAYQRLGIAGTLMQRQHDWVFAKGFDVIETEVLQENHAMQQLNERSGFKTAGVRFDKPEARIIYRKSEPD
jgi:ribosomal protein S18 acetylase RimI-like enzyme